jgi:ParB family chromosome partitioning protein
VLQLPNSVRTLLEEGKLTLGHAKVLVGLEDAAQITRLAREIVADGLTVRELERRLRGEAAPSGKKRAGRPRKTEQRPEVRRMEDRLRRFLQTDVSLTVSKNNKGTVTIQFFSADDLERLFDLLKVPD